VTTSGDRSEVGKPDLHHRRATRAVVDLDVLAGNVGAVRALLGPGTALMAVVKADGYGHGAVPVANVALASGAAALGVATVGEGSALRRAGIAAPILVLGAVDPGEVADALELGLDLTVATDELLSAVQAASRARIGRRPVGVHVKVDTGMRRYGAPPELAVALARRVAADPELSLAGLCSHFAAADEPDEEPTAAQAELLDIVVAELAAEGVRAKQIHAANSAAALRSSRYHHDLVRVGIALYGLPPAAGFALPGGFRPALTVRSRVTRLIDLAPGDTVGYGRTYRAARAERAALVPIGYADGFRRALSNRGWMDVGGERAPVRGRVSMDQTVVGIGGDRPVRVGDEVVVVRGVEPAAAPSVVEIAETLETIPYEIVTTIGSRVPRTYVGPGSG